MASSSVYHPLFIILCFLILCVIFILWIGGATVTTLKLGYTNPLTDTFGAHPQLGAVLDLNDGATFALVSPDGLEMAPPPKTLVPQGNIRTQGERITRAVFRHNREAVARVILGPGSSYASLIASVRTLLAWVNAPPAVPVTLQWQPPNASAPVYLDVVGAGCDISSDESEWLHLQFEPLEVVFVCRPGLRGDRITLSNLVVNPGFEQGAGVGPAVFNDPLSSNGAYTVLAGGPLGQDKTGFADALLAVAGANLLRYYRLDETSGTTAYDAGPLAQHGTTHGGPTQGVVGLLTGDADTCYTFTKASSQFVSCPVTGLPTGNSVFSFGCLFKFAANPASSAVLIAYVGAGAHNGIEVFIDVNGKLNAITASGSAACQTAAAVTLNTAHLMVLTWDGTTMSLYLDNAAAVTALPGAEAVSAPALDLASDGGNFWGGQLDECFVVGAALTSGNVSTLYSAFSSSPATAANTLTLPAGTQVSFGDAHWGPYNPWRVRLRYVAGLTGTFYLHFTDASNSLAVVVSATGIAVNQTIGGTVHALGTAGWVPINGMPYWLEMAQTQTTRPVTISNNPAYIGASVFADVQGAPGALLAAAGGPSFDLVTALSGAPQIGASGATLGIGGAFAQVQAVVLSGPGGWSFATSGTGVACGMWEQQAANCYAGGPQQGVGAARTDAAGAGTLAASWTNAIAGAIPSTAMAAASGQTLRASVYVRSSGVGSSCVQALQLSEYDTNGAGLRTTTLASVSGAQGAWVQMAGTVVLGASTVYAAVVLAAQDNTSGSANGSVWWDNAQCWNQTTTGAATMPYCELRFNQSPCQLLLSGLLGDLSAPAYVAWGTYLTSWPRGGTLTYALGRRGQVSAKGQMAASAAGFYGGAANPQASEVVDAGSYGGSYSKVSLSNAAAWAPRGVSPAAADLLGVYHLLGRVRSQDATPGSVQVRVKSDQNLDPWFVDVGTLSELGIYYGPFTSPLASAGVWTVADAGQVNIPPFAQGALSDPTQTYIVPRPEWLGSAVTGYEMDADWLLLLPVDGSLSLGVVNYPSNSAVASVTNTWLWCYLDGLLTNRAGVSDGPSWTYSLETASTPAPAHGGGGAGTSGVAAINVNSAADPSLSVDPTQTLAGQSGGINQVAAVVYDQAGAVLPLHAEVQYSPLYLYPR